MANKVFANTREIACKAAKGKTICAFPDVCFTPPDKVPPTPPGIPIPYPNTGFASDTTKGSKSVKISKKEIVLKNQSYFKKSTGDEAGCAAKKGVITGKITGKVYFQSWSMNIKVEGKNVTRHLDMTTNNHASQPGDTPPWPYIDTMSMSVNGNKDPCNKQRSNVKDKCKKQLKDNTYKSGRVNQAGFKRDMCNDKECKKAHACNLVPYKTGCCDGKTPHHVIPAHCFMPPGARGANSDERYEGCDKYDPNDAPCVCVSGRDKSNKRKQHARIHKRFDDMEDSQPNGVWTYASAAAAGAEATSDVTKCDKDCLTAQLNKYHNKDKGIPKNAKLRADSSGNKAPSPTLKVSNVTAPVAD